MKWLRLYSSGCVVAFSFPPLFKPAAFDNVFRSGELFQLISMIKSEIVAPGRLLGQWFLESDLQGKPSLAARKHVFAFPIFCSLVSSTSIRKCFLVGGYTVIRPDMMVEEQGFFIIIFLIRLFWALISSFKNIDSCLSCKLCSGTQLKWMFSTHSSYCSTWA